MAIICSTTLGNPISHFPPTPPPFSRPCFSRIRCAASMDSKDDLRPKLMMEFPYASPPIRDLMVELLSTVDTHLGSSLHPADSTLPRDVQHFQSSTGTAHASLHLTPGLPSSQVLFNYLFYLHPPFYKLRRAELVR